jgi:outer membrane protein assembly factor BamD (BamD/ComL family)
MRKIILLIALFAYCDLKAQSQNEIVELAEKYYQNSEYYQTITECMRYMSFYPNSKLAPQMEILMGKAYFKGGNYKKALEIIEKLNSDKDAEKNTKQESLYLMGKMRLLDGSPFFALRTYNLYSELYTAGSFAENVMYEKGIAAGLSGDIDKAFEYLNEYKEKYPLGRFVVDYEYAQRCLSEEVNRPRKSAAVALIGSIFVPGFGYFYTNNPALGTMSFLTNAVLIALSVNGFYNSNYFQGFIFGAAGLTFYQYSLIGAVNSVEKYNSLEGFKKNFRLGITTDF